VRLQAAQLFAQGVRVPQIAGLLRVSTKSVYAWRRAWRSGAEEALASKGPGGYACRLDDGQLAELAAALEAGPAACGRDRDQRWTLERVRALAGRLFGVRYTLWGTSYLPHRLGFSPQVPAHRAAQRDEAAVAAWRAATWARVRELAAATGAWICFEDEARQALRPPERRDASGTVAAGLWGRARASLQCRARLSREIRPLARAPRPRVTWAAPRQGVHWRCE
jgi:transposase